MKKVIWPLFALGIMSVLIVVLIAISALTQPVSENIQQYPVAYLILFGSFCVFMGGTFMALHITSFWGSRGQIATLGDIPFGRTFYVAGVGMKTADGKTCYLLAPLLNMTGEEYIAALSEEDCKDGILEEEWIVQKEFFSGSEKIVRKGTR